MPKALDPLRDQVDEIAIVLGGVSSDSTPELAEKYATLPVEEFDGPIDEDGRLLSFAMARNQSFEILRRAGVEYAMVVDTDDNWSGTENVKTVLGQMHRGNFPMCLFPYSYQGGRFYQPRIYRVDSGQWDGPCHNYWEINGGPRHALQTDMLTVYQERPETLADDRRHQNIRISEHWMAKNGDNCRLLQHMAKDLLVDREFSKSRDALERYFTRYEEEDRQDPEEYYQALHTLAAIDIMEGHYAESLTGALRALSIRQHGQSWTLAAEAALMMARSCLNDKALLDLAVFASEQAISTGKPRQNLHWHSEKLAGGIPLILKARALIGLGRNREAMGILDLAQMVDPENEEPRKLQKDLARMLGELV
jgi:tetratricopeptide (TPR) repeat protein